MMRVPFLWWNNACIKISCIGSIKVLNKYLRKKINKPANILRSRIMKKTDLKKLALLGLTGGVMLSTQGTVQAEIANSAIENGVLLAGGCGAHSCNGETKGSHKPDRNFASCGGCGSHKTDRNSAGCGSHKPDRNFIASCGGAGSCSNKGRIIAEANENLYASSGQLMTEDQLKSQLNEQGKQQYNSMSPEGKAMALKLASRSCKGTNDCKGQNACKADDHSCAGKGSCAGSSVCSFKDKNQAVKIAAQKQAEKRAKTNSGSY